MIKYLNHIMRRPFRQAPRKSRNGQVAVVLILITAVALIFYAISLNFSRLTQIKTIVTIASDSGAAQLASSMASYGQMVAKTMLDGNIRKCSNTNLWVTIISVIVAIILAVVSWGTLTWLGVAIIIVLGIASILLNALYLQPGLTSRWNRITSKILSTQDAIIENAIQGGLQKAVTDQKQVPDVWDMDVDRIWVPMATVIAANDNVIDPVDEISRFGVYYNERLRQVVSYNSANLQGFVDALEEFLYEGEDGWGIYDNSSFPCSLAECDPCCVPNTTVFYGVSYPPLENCEGADPCPAACVSGCAIGATGTFQPSLRPATCADSTNDVFWSGDCAARSRYGSSYPWIYQKYFENPNPWGFFSFRELIGRDDEHQLFEKNPASPNGIQIQNALSSPPAPPTNFLLQDTTRYYVSPPFASTTDNRRGIFPFFYKTADWGVDLQSLITNDALNPQCNWCSPGGGTVCAATATYPPEFSQLALPLAPASLIYNTTYCVDGINLVAGNPPLAVDKITFPSNIEEDDAPAAACAQRALGTPAEGFWKRGDDQYCADDSPPTWPYSSQCAKHGSGCLMDDGSTTGDCDCGETDIGGVPVNAAEFPEDVLDDIIHGLVYFIEWAESILAVSITDLNSGFTSWYPDAALWIEPGTDNEPWGSAASWPACFSCNATDGGLITWLKEIRMMIDRIQAWKDNTSYASAAGVCDEVWCVPDSTCPGGGSNTLLGTLGLESSTFGDFDADGTAGDVDDVVACLDWNVNDAVTTTGVLPVTATGNAEKFQACYDSCSNVLSGVNVSANASNANELCNALPRSLVPGFDGTTFANLNLTNVVCQTTCDNCVTACVSAPVPATCIAACACGGCSCSNAVCLAGVITVAQGSCAVPAYMTPLLQSAREAENQVAKFRQRETFLSNRVAEVDNMLDVVLIPARDKFEAFLYGTDTNGNGTIDSNELGPAANLIQYKINYSSTNTGNDEGLPYQAIYGWKDDDSLTAAGLWHVVKVDARIPGRCDNLCEVAGVSGDVNAWPRVRTYTENWNTTRCYELDNYEGKVKFRVTRWDQKRASSSFFFPNGVPIWRFRIPSLRPELGDTAITSILSSCAGKTITQFPDSTGTTIYSGAFILNKREDDAPGGYACWDGLHDLLARGVSSETCAKYLWNDGSNKGMTFKFVNCSNF